MSNQIVITSGAKVRNLSGVLTASSGVVDSVGFGTANGVATLDSNGKVPLSQLPASVVTYLGTWNAATNTPTLANGTGDVGDLYICNVAGTVNFGAGPITFAVGDWVIYNGSQWQKSAGSSGTVTSVAMTVPTGLSVTGSPITTSGTLAVSLSSGYTIPTTSFLAGLVPYTGATTDVDLGAHVLNAQSLHVKGTAGAGHLGLKHQSAAATGTANESLIYANVDGDLAWQNDNLYLTTLSTHANTANRVYTFPNASGTIALTSDISYPVTSVFGRTGAVTAQSGDYTTTQVTEGTNLYYTDARARGAISLTTTGTSGAATYNSTTGVLNVPNYTPDLSNYVTLNTSQTITGSKTFNAYILSSAGGGNQATVVANISTLHSGSSGVNGFGFNVNNNIYFGKGLDNGGVFSWNNTTVRYYTLPDATGTIALTSDIPSLSGYVQGSGTTNYLPKFTASGTIGNSSIIDNGSITAYTNAFTIYQTGGTGAAFYLSGGGTDSVMSSITSSSTYQNLNLLASTLAFYTGTLGGLSTTERMRITPAGNVGIGTSSPQSLLDVKGATPFIRITDSSVTGETGLIMDAGGGTIRGGLTINYGTGEYKSYCGVAGNGYFQTFHTNGSERMRITSTGNVGIGTSSPLQTAANRTVTTINGTSSAILNLGINGVLGCYFYADASLTQLYSDTTKLLLTTGAATNIEFQTNNTERMRITSGGNIGIGTSAPSGKLEIQAGVSTDSAPHILLGGNGYSGFHWINNTAYYIGQNSQSRDLRVYSGNNISLGVVLNPNATSWTGYSDERLKTNIENFGSVLENVLSLRTIKYHFKDVDSEDSQKRYGLIAQDLVGKFDEVLSKSKFSENDETEYYGVRYTELIPVLVKAIQELSAKVTALENKLN